MAVVPGKVLHQNIVEGQVSLSKMRESLLLSKAIPATTNPNHNNSINPFIRVELCGPDNYLRAPFPSTTAKAIKFQHEFWKGYSNHNTTLLPS
jgi:hypothetical protein